MRCPRRCIFRAVWSSAGNLPTVWSEWYKGSFYRCPGHLCATHTAGYLNLATVARAMAIHSHGGSAVVTVIRGAGDLSRPLPVSRRWLRGQPDDGGCLHTRALEMVEGHVLVVIRQPSMRRHIHLHLHT